MTSMRDTFHVSTTQLLDADPRLAVVLADIGASRFREAQERHPERVINVGIREQLMIGVAAGLSLTGLRPIVHSYASFLVERPFEMLKVDLSHNEAGAVLVSIGASYDASHEGRTHQAPEDVALLATLPGWEIYVPGHRREATGLLRHAAAGDGRAYLRLSESANRAARPIRPGALDVVRRGRDLTIVAVGPMLDRTLDALDGIGFDATVLYATTVLPFDTDTLLAEAGEEVVFVEPYLEGTTATIVAAALADRPRVVRSIGVPRGEHRRYGTPDDHERAHGLDVAGLRERLGRRAPPAGSASRRKGHGGLTASQD